MTPLPFPAYLGLGIVAALVALASFAAWAERGGSLRFVAGVVCGALAWDALRVLQWRSVESSLPVHPLVPLLLVGALFAVRFRRLWKALGGPSNGPSVARSEASEDEKRTSRAA